MISQQPINLGLTFNDVLLVPKKTPVNSRQEVDVTTQFSKHLKLNIPIVTANMDTVTESAMAITIARAGGLGIIHRFLTITQQVDEVIKVKRWGHVIIDDPYTLPITATIKDVWAARERYGNTTFLITNSENKLAGIVTARDMMFEDDLSLPIEKIMTPRAKLITGQPGMDVDQAKIILHQNRIEKLPLVDGQDRVVGLITTQDIMKRKKYPQAANDKKGRLLVGAAIGVKDDYIERAAALIKAGTDVLVLDIAHGHAEAALTAIKTIRQQFGDVELVAGNVATADATKDLIKAGVDAIKVGVGPGAACTTRIVTGAGVPQLTAVLNCAAAAAGSGVPVIADGGIQTSGDVAKALAAGAATVMCGNLFAGTDESPGFLVTRQGRKVKIFQGMASRGAAQKRNVRERRQIDDTTFNEMVPEGVEAIVPYRGSAQDIINQLVGGLRSGISYCGGHNIKEMQTNAEFVQITAAGRTESLPHDAEVIQ